MWRRSTTGVAVDNGRGRVGQPPRQGVPQARKRDVGVKQRHEARRLHVGDGAAQGEVGVKQLGG